MRQGSSGSGVEVRYEQTVTGPPALRPAGPPARRPRLQVLLAHQLLVQHAAEEVGDFEPSAVRGVHRAPVAQGLKRSPRHSKAFKLSVGRTCSVYLFEIEGLLTQESRPGQISAAQRGRISDLECSGMIGIGIGRMDVDTTTSIPDP